MKNYFAYVRVSTVKQGVHGSSLQEQHDAITGFAARNNMQIVNWFEERETAAKIGRGEFNRMVAALKKRKAAGVIFHKIDRSARNLKDWSAVQDLAELGIDVRFTQESINLGSNEGKLTGDFLAVISSHYIRNLREEVKKGIRGRLKQGLYPFMAHVGYLNQGGGKAKIPDPDRAPFVRNAFELYATGRYSLHALSDELYLRGFTNTAGKRLGTNRLSEMLRNPFYIGIIKVSGETYPGVHQPIVPTTLFERVQRILDGNLIVRTSSHDFAFRRTIRCAYCRYNLIGETRKGHVYYRCHTRECPTVSLREETIDESLRAHLAPLNFHESEIAEMKTRASSFAANDSTRREDKERAVRVNLESVGARLGKLTDAFIDGLIERDLFEERKLSLLMRRTALEEERNRIENGNDAFTESLTQYLGLLESLSLSYEIAIPDERRRLIKTVTSDLRAEPKKLVVELQSPFREVANLAIVPSGGPLRGVPRTSVDIQKVLNILTEHVASSRSEDVPTDR